tara:strand:- start:96 stop:722 length:627 start_codon:yes stop_codon:yes gene_type:complete
MAQEIINVGSGDNSGNGDPLRTAMIKVQNNFDELYTLNPDTITQLKNINGWAFYVENQSPTSTQTINTVSSKMVIDGAGATSTSAYLPYQIRGISELWDTVNNKITPINIGDGYTIRVDFEVTGKTGAPNDVLFQLDIGGGVAPSNDIISRTISTSKAPPFSVSIGLPIFSLSTFKTNGGQIFLTTDSGTVEITKRQISIHRISSGNL